MEINRHFHDAIISFIQMCEIFDKFELFPVELLPKTTNEKIK